MSFRLCAALSFLIKHCGYSTDSMHFEMDEKKTEKKYAHRHSLHCIAQSPNYSSESKVEPFARLYGVWHDDKNGPKIATSNK